MLPPDQEARRSERENNMAKADLHVHSKHSEHPSEWFLQRLGTKESYTEPEFVYQTAKERGMDFVTITDHNRIEGVLALRQAHPEDVFTGVESTAYFPEDGCKIHFLMYGFDERQFAEIQRLREDVYALREYVREQDIAHTVAHATFHVNGKLRLYHLERLLLLFNVFEGINGGRNRINNETWMSVMSRLTPERLDDLRRRHGLEPWGRTPWIKSVTAGSDDHAGLFIGRAHTLAEAGSPDEFLEALRRQKTQAAGRHNDYKALAFTFYKIAYDFSKSKSSALSQSMASQLTETMFDRRRPKEPAIKSWIRDRRMRSLRRKAKDSITPRFLDLVEMLRRTDGRSIEDKIEIVYDRLSGIADAFFAPLVKALEDDLASADMVSLIQNISSSLPGIFLAVPFYSSLRHMYQGRQVLNELEAAHGAPHVPRAKNVLWFSDTLDDMNGVAVTLSTISRAAHEQNRPIRIVTSLDKKEQAVLDLPPTIINLPSIHGFTLPGLDGYTLKIPSFLQALKIIGEQEPDQVIISTPGPIGLFGLLVSKLFNIPAAGIFHTDFALQSMEVFKDEAVAKLIDDYLRWFYAAVDEMRVPTQEYGRILSGRGYRAKAVTVFRRGVDGRYFAPRSDARRVLAERYGLGDGNILLYAGRISQEKNLDFLIDVYSALLRDRPGLRLLVAGSGPYLADLKERCRELDGVIFAGKLQGDDLVDAYAGADLLVFPSTTDTYGMVVAEAQACGLPAVVSDKGGPQELVLEGESGFVVGTQNKEAWRQEIDRLLRLKAEKPARFKVLREAARRAALGRSDWNAVLDALTGLPVPANPPTIAQDSGLFALPAA